LDAQTGKEQWKVDFVQELGSPLPAFGFVSSPLLYGDHVYVQAGGSFCKLHKQTGQIIWRALKDDGGMFGSAFSSPVIDEIHGVRQVLVQTRTLLAGVAPDTGRVLWTHETPAFRGMNILTPTVIDNRVFTSAYGGRSLLLDIQRSGETWEAVPSWVNSAQGYMSSPVVVDDHIYIHLRNRRFTCLSLESGERTWTSNPFGEYCSLVVQGTNILALDQRGELLLIRAKPEGFDLLASRKLSDHETWAHLAASGNQIFVRDLEGLRVFLWQEHCDDSLVLNQ
jgi:outer membrane protein assembly factor BamB